MANYAASTTQTLSTGISAMALACPSTVRRALIYFISLSSYDTPSDTNIRWNLIRHTGSSSGAGSITPVALDSGDSTVTPLMSAFSKPTTTDFTTTGIPLIDVNVHLRNSWEWYAPPRGELVTIPTYSGSGYGIALRTPTVNGANTTPLINPTFHYSE